MLAATTSYIAYEHACGSYIATVSRNEVFT